MAIKYPCTDFFTNLRLGQVEGQSFYHFSGTATVGSTAQSLYPHASIQATRALDDTPSTVKVSSSSGNDTSAGTGARTVRVDGLDSAGVQVSQTVVLTGQTAVVTTQVYKAINEIVVLTAGTGLKNAGNIWVGNGTVTTGVPATKYAACPVGENDGHSGVYTVPEGFKFIVLRIIAEAADTGKFVTGKIFRGSTNGLEYIAEHLDLGPGTVQVAGNTVLEAGEYLRSEYAVDTGTAEVSVDVLGALVEA